MERNYEPAALHHCPQWGYEGNRMKLQIVEMIQTMETNYE